MTAAVLPASTLERSQLYYNTERPWLALYGLRLKPRAVEQADGAELGLVQKLLPEELLLQVFAKLPAHHLGAVLCTCKQWRTVGTTSSLWQAACQQAFPTSKPQAQWDMVRAAYGGSWKAYFLDRPHLRFDGLYVSRNTYIRTGIREWQVRNPVHLVCYFRYFRFLPDGRFLYKTSPDVLNKVAKALRGPASSHSSKTGDGVHRGSYTVVEEKVFTSMVYANNSTTEVRTCMKLRSTVPGANNRLDAQYIVSYDHADGVVTNLSAEEDDGSERVEHQRGLGPFVFVPWEQVQTSYLNKQFTWSDL